MADCSACQFRHISPETAWRTRGTRIRPTRLMKAVRWTVVLLLLCAPHLQAADSPPPDVLILNSYAPGYQWSDDELTGVLSVLRQTYREIEPVIEYLDFKRFTEPSREAGLIQDVVDPNAMVTDMAKMLSRLLGDHIELQVTPLAQSCTLMADRGQLSQMLLNLCINARDAMPSGGRIRVQLKRVSLGDADGYSELKAGPYVVLTVSDTGCGIPHEILDRLFEPFYTTKVSGKGTGLGLAVVYGIVRQHNGAIRVYSEIGKGSVFTILLPIHASQPEEPTADLSEEFMPGEGTILLAEDDPQVRRITTHILTRHDFRVIAAADGEEAETLIAQNHTAIRLAVLDVLMPKRNGRQVFDFLRTRHPEIRVLFCTGYSAEMLPPEIAPKAGVALINKPYSARELLTQVHRLLSA